VTERPIIFSAPMVRALLAGRKTQTRRLAKVRPGLSIQDFIDRGEPFEGGYRATREMVAEPRYAVGDRLYVREAWSHSGTGVWTIEDARRSAHTNGRPIYRATDETDAGTKFWPSIHMPREFSRLTLHVEGVKVERLQEISEEDAWAEGVCSAVEDGQRSKFGEVSAEDRRAIVTGIIGGGAHAFNWLWDGLHTNPGARWQDNPFVVALTFRVIRGNIDRGGRDG